MLPDAFLSHLVFRCPPCSSGGKDSARNAGDLGLIPELGRSPREGKGYPLQYSGLENSGSMGLQKVGRDFRFHLVSRLPLLNSVESFLIPLTHLARCPGFQSLLTGATQAIYFP